MFDNYVYYRDVPRDAGRWTVFEREFARPATVTHAFSEFCFHNDWGEFWIDASDSACCRGSSTQRAEPAALHRSFRNRNYLAPQSRGACP